jgi:hypothetical protein
MLRADAASRADYYEKLSNVKAILPEEIRKRENLPPLTAEQKKELNPAPPAQFADRPPARGDRCPPGWAQRERQRGHARDPEELEHGPEQHPDRLRRSAIRAVR